MTYFPGMEPPPVLPQPTAESDDFYTPAWLLKWLPPIGLDPCAAAKASVRATSRFDLRDGVDGLAMPWRVDSWASDDRAIVYCNPPYSNCAEWVAKCRQEGDRWGRAVVALIPAKPGEAYWHEHIWNVAGAVGFLRGRIRFDTVNGPAPDCATFGSALVVWGSAEAGIAAVRTICERSAADKRAPKWVDAGGCGSTPSPRLAVQPARDLTGVAT